jgi:hypothetical protein
MQGTHLAEFAERQIGEESVFCCLRRNTNLTLWKAENISSGPLTTFGGNSTRFPQTLRQRIDATMLHQWTLQNLNCLTIPVIKNY